MLCFSYAVEKELCDYLVNNITGSVTYPILRGFTQNYSGSFNYPVISVHLTDYEEVITYTGDFLGNVSIRIVTAAQNSASYDSHGAAVDGVYNAIGQVEKVQSWTNSPNNPSSSLCVINLYSNGVNNMFQDNLFITETRWGLTGQQSNPTNIWTSTGIG